MYRLAAWLLLVVITMVPSLRVAAGLLLVRGVPIQHECIPAQEQPLDSGGASSGAGELFGMSCSSGLHAIVGAPNAGGSYQGAVYLFMRTNDTAPFWHQMQLL